MNTALAKFELKEKDLELVVNEKTLGSLTTNAKQIKAMVEAALPNYDISNYDESNIASAKQDKAMLNKASKALNDRRIEFEREFMQPFAEFKAVVGETVTLIKECSGKIDTVVKQSEENERKAKQQSIDEIWARKEFSLVPLSKISSAKWLNKGETLKLIETEIDDRIARINDDIKTIEAIGEDVDLLKSLYLDTLNLNNTIQYANTLKQNRERAKADAEARAKLEAERQARAAEAKAAYEASQAEISVSHSQPEPVREEVIPEPPQAPPIVEKDISITFTVTDKRSRLIALREYMKVNGYRFE